MGEAYKNGDDIKDIAKALGRTERSVMIKLCRYGYRTPVNRRKKFEGMENEAPFWKNPF